MITTNHAGEKQIVVMLGEHEKDIIKQMCILALENNSWNITQAAKSIGINYTTLRMRMTRWGLNADLEKQELQTERVG